MATVTRSDAGSGRTVCTAPPPPPGSHVFRCGWSQRPRTSSNEQPPSMLRQSECGILPLGKADRAVVGLLPRPTEVVAPHDRRAPVPVLDAGQDPWPWSPGVDRDGGDLLR